MRNSELRTKDLRRFSSNSNHFFLTATSSFVFRITSPCLWNGAYISLQSHYVTFSIWHGRLVMIKTNNSNTLYQYVFPHRKQGNTAIQVSLWESKEENPIDLLCQETKITEGRDKNSWDIACSTKAVLPRTLYNPLNKQVNWDKKRSIEPPDKQTTTRTLKKSDGETQAVCLDKRNWRNPSRTDPSKLSLLENGWEASASKYPRYWNTPCKTKHHQSKESSLDVHIRYNHRRRSRLATNPKKGRSDKRKINNLEFGFKKIIWFQSQIQW